MQQGNANLHRCHRSPTEARRARRRATGGRPVARGALAALGDRRRSVAVSLALLLAGLATVAGRVDAQVRVEPVAHRAIAPDLPVVRLSSDVRIVVDGAQRVARFEIDEQFQNRSHRLMEGDYLYPIPAGAVFTELSLWMGEEELKGEMLPADRARGIYEDIVRRRKDPALVELVGHGLLRARVFPIEPGQTRRVRLRYTQVLGRDGDLLRLRYPRTTGMISTGHEEPVPRPMPRPVPLPEPSRMPQPVPDVQSQRELPRSFRLEVRITAAARFATPYSPTHTIEVREPDSDQMVVGVETGGRLGRDFELLLPLRERFVGANVLTQAYGGEPGWFMLLVSPPAATDRVEIPRDVSVVLDVSGSMAGDKIVQARAALEQMLDGLRTGDRFRLIAFSSFVRSFRDGFTDADGAALAAARDWVARLEADGSTNIEAALREALVVPVAEGRLPIVLFLTDGLPTVGESSPERIAATAADLAGPQRLFAFGVGHDVNTWLLDRLVEGGRGSVNYVRPDESVEAAVASLARKISHPALSDLRLVSSPVELEDIHPSSLPDLFYGEDLVVFGRYRGSGAGELVLEGRRGGRTERLGFEVRFAAREDRNDFIPRLWASRKAGALTAQLRLHGANPELIEEIRQLGLRYGILTEYTSYLVEEPGMRLLTAGQALSRAREMDAPAAAQTGAVAFERAERSAKMRQSATLDEAEALGVTAASPMVDADSVAGTPGRGDAPGTVRSVGTRLFVMRDGTWVDVRHEPQQSLVEVAPFGDAYFELLRRVPSLAPFAALGERVIIAADGLALKIAPEGAASLDPSQLDAVAAAFADGL